MQFNRGPVDAGDGLIGYELECEYAAGILWINPRLKLRMAFQTTDCDGDGGSNLVEVNAGPIPRPLGFSGS